VLGDKEVGNRFYAAEALGKIGEPAKEAVPALIKALGDEKAEKVRSNVAEALGKIGDAQAVPALIEALSDEVWGVRYSAARALGEIGEPAVPALIEALSKIGEPAAKALRKIRTPEAMKAVEEYGKLKKAHSEDSR